MLSVFLFFTADQSLLSAHLAVAEHVWSTGGRGAPAGVHLHGPSARRGVFEHRHVMEDRGLLELSPEHVHPAPSDWLVGAVRHSHGVPPGHRPHPGVDHLKELLPVGVASPLPSVAAAESTRLSYCDEQPRPLQRESVEACARAPPDAV